MTREEAIFRIKELQKTYASMDKKVAEAVDMAIEALSAEVVHKPDYSFEADMVRRLKEALSAEAVEGWIPLSHDDNGLGTDFPYERDGEWVIVTDGKSISVERIKKDAYDHFFPNGRWFKLEDVIAWMPMPEPYKEDNDG